MADLLSAAERVEIRSAIQDVFDTYMKEPAILHIRNQGEKLSAFNESIEDSKAELKIELFVLYIPDTSDTDAESEQRKEGYFDNSEGVIFIPVSTLKGTTPILWDDLKGADIVPNRDTIIIKGKERTIMGVNPVGPDESSFFLVKLQYFNKLISKGVGEA